MLCHFLDRNRVLNYNGGRGGGGVCGGGRGGGGADCRTLSFSKYMSVLSFDQIL